MNHNLNINRRGAFAVATFIGAILLLIAGLFINAPVVVLGFAFLVFGGLLLFILGAACVLIYDAFRDDGKGTGAGF